MSLIVSFFKIRKCDLFSAYWNGDVTRLTAPEDTKGRRCGVDQDVTDKRYLLFYDITKCVKLSVFVFGCNTKQVHYL